MKGVKGDIFWTYVPVCIYSVSRWKINAKQKRGEGQMQNGGKTLAAAIEQDQQNLSENESKL